MRRNLPGRALPRPLALHATPIEVSDAYRSHCPRGERHELLIMFYDRRWRLFCTKGCRERDILRAFGLPADTLRYRPPSQPRYPYFSPDGKLLFEVVRRPDVARGPDRFVFREHAAGGFQAGLVYRLDEMLAAPLDEPIFWVEGEHDVESLRAHGLVAVTTSFGALDYDPRQARWFEGRKVILVPDNDEPGRLYGDNVEASLRGVAADVTRLELPAPTKDVSEWLDNGGKVEDLRQVAGLPVRLKPEKTSLGTVEAAILAAIDRSEHRSLTTDALPMVIAGLPGEEAWNARAKEPIIRYRGVPRPELAKARAGISRALGSLTRRGSIQRNGRHIRRAQPAPPPTIRARGSPVGDQHRAPRPTV
jgi:hypothetical protein